MSTKVAKEKVPSITPDQLDWASMDAAITAGKCKLKPFSEDLKCKSDDLKKMFVEHYGDRIVFKRGRKGGVYWKDV